MISGCMRTLRLPKVRPRPERVRVASALGPVFAFGLMLLGMPPAGAVADLPEVLGIRFGVHGTRTRVVMDMSRRTSFKVRALEAPPRLVIELPEVRWRVRPHPMARPRGLATAQRYGRLRPGASRLVVDIRRPFAVVASRLLPPSATSRYWRLVVDLAPTGRSTLPRVARDRGRRPPVPVMRPDGEPALGEIAPAAPPVARTLPETPVIVLDPGHGGVDPGTRGVNGVDEKEVTLAFARAVRRELLKSGRYRVFLTRSDDRFIPLRERVRFAQERGADLFMSLHADSIADPTIAGASVYTLSETASDAEAARLARKENKVDILAGVDLTGQDPIVASILIDLAWRETNNRSIRFAELLTEELGRVIRLLRRNRRFAGFVVLKSPETPSVLIELGYLSNERNAALLTEPGYRQRVAVAVRRAVDRYFDGLKPPL